MSTVQTLARDLPAEARAALLARAATQLRDGGLAVLPTETVYGLAASAASRPAIEKLAAIVNRAAPWVAPTVSVPFATWHAAGPAVARDVLRLKHPVHRRLLARLTPGPVRFLIETGPEDIARIERELGALPAVFTGAGLLALRVPDHDLTQTILEQARTPVIAERLAAAGWGSDRDASAALADDRAARAGIATVIDDGPTRHGRASTTLKLRAGGGWEIFTPGACEERYIRRRLERNILFICTGNTCRSPMAETIARAIADESAGGVPTRVSSAGVAAAEGDRATPEAWEALRGLGFEPGMHRSRDLTRAMITEADVIYGMTGSHVRAVLAIDPTAGAKVRTLDPAGQDVPDPIGAPAEIYRKTAQRLAELVRARLKELENE
ncbi:MAG: Sua5/YciO/YrdC/YwlC family protein [Phycisphaerales bacterium]|nr:Sua5/YciO/YrdC/YwlC family protein [Phycisphaerales bacterium]